MGTDILGSDALPAVNRSGLAAQGVRLRGGEPCDHLTRALTLFNTLLILLVFGLFIAMRSQDMAELRQSLEVARQERRDLQKSIDDLNKKAILRGP